MAVKKQTFAMLPSNEKVEMVAIHKETHKAFMKIIELSEFQSIKKDAKYNYRLYQIGFSQFKDIIQR